jgi:peptidyl-prolyl cis-trans isomerase A (cyclophilin A)
MFETNRGNFIVDIYPEIAPVSAPHFISLINSGFYNNIRIHRFEPDFVVQMGQVLTEDGSNTPIYPNDPKKAQLGGVTIQDEPCLSENTYMTISFAKTDAANSASCQFFINLGDNRRLDTYNHGFSVMAQVVHGQDIVRKLRVGDVIGRAYLIQSPDVK